MNGVAQTYSVNTISNTIQASNDTWKIGVQGTSNYYNGYIQSLSVVNTVLSLDDHINYYNNGKPKNPQMLFGANCKYFFNPDNSNDTAQFAVTDRINSITATSINMENADLTTVTPY